MSIYLDDIVVAPEQSHNKMIAVFYMVPTTGKPRVKAVRFGARPYKDFTMYYEEDPDLAYNRRDAYLERHRPREEDVWDSNPMTPAALSKWILWNRPTIEESIHSFRKKFKLQKPPKAVKDAAVYKQALAYIPQYRSQAKSDGESSE